MYSAGSDGKLLMWNMTDGKRSNKVIYSQESVNRVVNVSKDEHYLALGTDDNNILLIDLKNRDSAPKSITGHRGGTIFDLVFASDGKTFFSSGIDNRILMHTMTSTKEVALLTTRAKTLDISPDGKRLAAGTQNGDVILIDLTTDNYSQTKVVFKRNRLAQENPINALHFSNSGNFLAIGDDQGTVTIWDLNNKVKSGPTLTGFLSAITDVEFSPDDKLIAASSRDYSVRMWDIENIYDLPTVFDDHGDWVWSIDFHPNGKEIVTGSADGIIRVYATKPDDYASKICGLVKGNLSQTEWNQYVGQDMPYRETCKGLPKRTEE
jgi:WD40 repeat protein